MRFLRKLSSCQVCYKQLWEFRSSQRMKNDSKLFYSTSKVKSNINEDNDNNYNNKDMNAEELLENATVGTGPYDELDEDDEWHTSPYPPGSAVNWRQSQARKSLRPRTDPRETSIILFPGQGSQFVGMGQKLLKFPVARDIFDAANEILKFDLLKLMLQGPKKVLDRTIYCQPAVYVCSLAAIEKLKEENPNAIENCMATAGFSVGELTALTFAGVFSFDAGLKLVKVRAEAMQIASEMKESGMASVIYGHESDLHLACVKAKEWCLGRGIENAECKIATYIGPNIKVIAGNMEALRYLEANKELYKLDSVDKIKGMSGAFHSNLMRPAVWKFVKALMKVEAREPIISVHSNVDGKLYTNANHVMRQLPSQMYRPLKWEQTLHILYERAKESAHPNTYICGPGSNLKNYLEVVNKIASQFCCLTDV